VGGRGGEQRRGLLVRGGREWEAASNGEGREERRDGKGGEGIPPPPEVGSG